MFKSKDLTPALFFSVFVAAFGSAFQHGYHTGVLNVPQETIEEWLRTLISNTTSNAAKEEQDKTVRSIFSLIASIYCIGGMLGGVLTRIWIGVIGLKWGILANNVLVYISCALMGLSYNQNNYYLLIIGRFLIGVNSGLNGGLVPVYLSEIAPVHLRGGVGSVYQLFITVAILMAQVVGTRDYLGQDEKWPYLFAVPIIPSLMQTLLLPLCWDSPRYLMLLKKEDDAGKALDWFRHRHDPNVQKELEMLKYEVDSESKMPAVNVAEMFSNPVLRKPLIISCLLMVAQQFSGINAVIFYSTSSFKVARLDSSTAQIGTLLMGAMNVAMTIVSTLIVDLAGRKTLLILGFSLMFVDTLLLCGCMTLALTYENVAVAYTSIVFIALFVIFFAVGPGSIPWFLVSELFLTKARVLAVSFAVPVNWFANFVVTLSFPFFQSMMKSYVFLFFAFFHILFVIYAAIFIPETKNRSVSEITADFGVGRSLASEEGGNQ